MKKKYILAFDQGTTSSRSILFRSDASVAAVAQIETRQLYPGAGKVEQDPAEIWHNQLLTARQVLQQAGIGAGEVMAIGITNQRESTVVWNRHTGEPVCNAIIWQDKRTALLCQKMKEDGWETHVRERTGLIIDSYFSATKLHWILNHVPGATELAERGDLLFGTIDTFLIWKLSGGRLHITDASNASRTMLFDINTFRWDSGLTGYLGIPEAMLPEVVDSSMIYGETDPDIFQGTSIPIAGAAGDQQAALFGQTCFEEGMAKNTYGTGCFMLMNTGSRPVLSRNGLLTTIAWRLNGEIVYALEGSVFVAGAAIKWLRDALGLIASAQETDRLAREIQSNEGVYMVPAFAGLGAPYWDMEARAIVTGLTLGSDKRHLVRAALEAMAYQTRDVLRAMESDSGLRLSALSVDGGAAANDFLMQFQSDVLNIPVIRPGQLESTARGAAFLAGIACGLWTRDGLRQLQGFPNNFTPVISDEHRRRLCDGWARAVARARSTHPMG